MGAFSLPPGDPPSDTPGNRPEDAAEEAFWENLNAAFVQKHKEKAQKLLDLLEDPDVRDLLINYTTLARSLLGVDTGNERLREALKRAEEETIEGVLDLMNDAMLPFDTKRPGGITTEGNGYGFWFVADIREPILRAPLTAQEISELIHARRGLA
jgi:hypothetical protein